MKFDEYQNAAHKTSGSTNQENAIIMSALGLAGESGEVADLIKKHAYHKHLLNQSKLQEELGDILWYIAEMCTNFEWELEEIAKINIRKLQKRYPEGFSSEHSINREQGPKGLTGYSGFTAPDMVPIVPCPICGACGWHSFSCTNKGY